MIKIQIRKTNVAISEALRTHVESRLGLALGRFGGRIGKVMVRFSHAGGDRSGSHRRCQIEVPLRPQCVRVEDIDADLFAALNHATDRVLRSIERALERQAPT